MPSVVSICNLALSNIGKDNINDLNEASTEARACKQFYEISRDTLLQAFPWKFAATTASLGELIANPRGNRWGHAYQRPADCLKIMAVNDRLDLPHHMHGPGVISGGLAYDVEGGVIYANASPAFLTYIQRIDDVTQFSPLFVDALAWHLAVRLAMPITRDPKIRAEAFQLAMQMQNTAAAADANEVRETSDHSSEVMEARL